MARLIQCKINVQALKKEKLFVGKKGIYANITLIEKKNEHGDWMIVEDTTKEERDQNIKSTILGNGKNKGWGDSDKPAGSNPNTNVSVDDLGI